MEQRDRLMVITVGGEPRARAASPPKGSIIRNCNDYVQVVSGNVTKTGSHEYIKWKPDSTLTLLQVPVASAPVA